ncbi:MAG: peptidase [Caulobacteraceae bacterium]|nr:peptidase [Caulobacteraceae bacterium]
MEVTVPLGTPIAGGVMFYERPEPLNSEMHANLGLHTMAKPYGFASRAKSLPLSVSEFVESSVNYPIIFSTGDNPMPMAVTGLAEDQNLFVESDDSYVPGAYIPAYIRRFPFVVAEDSEGDRLVVCIERATPMLDETGEIRLFENGAPTAYTQNCIDFCTRFEDDRRRTAAFMAYLKPFDLFRPREITQPVFKDGKPIRIPLTTVNAISEERLAALPPETLVEMRDNGALMQIHAHLISQANWDKLIAMRAHREAYGAGLLATQ